MANDVVYTNENVCPENWEPQGTCSMEQLNPLGSFNRANLFIFPFAAVQRHSDPSTLPIKRQCTPTSHISDVSQLL